MQKHEEIQKPLMISIWDLTYRTCRWPYDVPGTSQFRFCGRDTGGASYCAYHLSLAYKPRHRAA